MNDAAELLLLKLYLYISIIGAAAVVVYALYLAVGKLL